MSSKWLAPDEKKTCGGFGVYAADNEKGPKVRFSNYVPVTYRQVNNGAEMWAVLELLQGF